MTTTKVGIEIDVRMEKAEAQIKRLTKELDQSQKASARLDEKLKKTSATAKKTEQNLGGLKKQLDFVKQNLAGPAGVVALMVGAVRAMDGMSKRAIELTGDTRGLAGSWQRLRNEWSESLDQLILIADRAPLAMRTLKDDTAGLNGLTHEQTKSVSFLAIAWDDYIKKLTPMAGEDWLPAKAVAALNRELDELTAKQARPMLGGFGADVGAGHLAGGLTAARDKAAITAINRHHKKLAEDTDTLNKLFQINADATDKMAWASRHHTNERKKEVDLFKAERAEFEAMMGHVEMGRAGTSLKTSIDKEQFGRQLDDAKMAEAGINAKKAQAEFEAEEHEKAQERLREHNEALKASLDAEIEIERRKREAIQATMQSRMAVADATATLTSQSVELASVGAEAMIKGGKRREKAMKALAGSEMIVIGITESVKALAAFAGQNYVEGAMHVVASATAFAKGGQLLSQAGGSRGVGGGAGASGFASGSAFGPGTDSGGGVQSTSGGSGRPSSNGPVSEAEESVQRSGRGGRPGPTRQRDAQPAPQINVMYMGAPDAAFGDFVRKSIKTSERRSGKVTS